MVSDETVFSLLVAGAGWVTLGGLLGEGGRQGGREGGREGERKRAGRRERREEGRERREGGKKIACNTQ